MEVKVKVYDSCKYDKGSQKVAEVEYENVSRYEVVSEPDRVAEIESCTDGSCIDDYHEYLVLYFENGETSTFRNSYVDLFLM